MFENIIKSEELYYEDDEACIDVFGRTVCSGIAHAYLTHADGSKEQGTNEVHCTIVAERQTQSRTFDFSIPFVSNLLIDVSKERRTEPRRCCL